jgi:hypothetical protein
MTSLPDIDVQDSRATRFVPATGLPLLYFAFAHLCLALGFGALVVSPGLPAGFFHHPRMSRSSTS